MNASPSPHPPEPQDAEADMEIMTAADPLPCPHCGVIAPPIIVPGRGPLDTVAHALVDHLLTIEATLTELRRLVEEAVL